MRLRRFHVKNYRSLRDIEVRFGGNNILVIIGENNVGKSNLLKAFALFFNDKLKPSEDDFFRKNVNNEIELALEVEYGREELPDELFPCEKGLVTYRVKFVLDKNGNSDRKCFVEASFPRDENLRLFEMDNRRGIKVKAKRKLISNFGQLGINTDELSDENYIESAKKLILEYINENNSAFENMTISVTSSSFKKLLLSKFEIVKLPASEKLESTFSSSSKSPFGKLLQRNLGEDFTFPKVEEKLDEIARILEKKDKLPKKLVEFQDKLIKEINNFIPGIKIRIDLWVPTLQDMVDNASIIVDDGIATQPELKGHGVQRLLFLCMLKILSESGENVKKEGFLFILEEPELYLHPHSQRTFMRVMKALAEQGNIVLISTHSPFFATLARIDEIVLLKKIDGETRVFQYIPGRPSVELDRINRFISEYNSEMFFARGVIFVEGESEKYGIPVLFDKVIGKDGYLDEKGISVVPVGSKNSFPMFVKITKAYDIPTFVIRDKDAENIKIDLDSSQIITWNEDFEHALVTAKNSSKILSIILHHLYEINDSKMINDLHNALMKYISSEENRRNISPINSEKDIDRYIDQLMKLVGNTKESRENIRREVIKFIKRYSKPRAIRFICNSLSREDVSEEINNCICKIGKVFDNSLTGCST